MDRAEYIERICAPTFGGVALPDFMRAAGSNDPGGFGAWLEAHREDPDLTAVAFFEEMERRTPIHMLYFIPRNRSRNRLPSGLQQRYVDHCSVMMHAIDRVVAGDKAWFDARAVGGGEIDGKLWDACVEAARRLVADPDLRLTLYYGAGLHDVGKLCGRSYGLDSEDSTAVIEEMFAPAIPQAIRGAVDFCVRCHDVVQYLHTGHMTSAFLRAARGGQDPSRDEMDMLALIQLCGAASLGAGRIDKEREAVVAACLDPDRWPVVGGAGARWALLHAWGQARIVSEGRWRGNGVREAGAGLNGSERLLDRSIRLLPDWGAFDTARWAGRIGEVAEAVEADGSGVDHYVIEVGAEGGALVVVEEETLGNGTRAGRFRA